MSLRNKKEVIQKQLVFSARIVIIMIIAIFTKNRNKSNETTGQLSAIPLPGNFRNCAQWRDLSLIG